MDDDDQQTDRKSNAGMEEKPQQQPKTMRSPYCNNDGLTMQGIVKRRLPHQRYWVVIEGYPDEFLAADLSSFGRRRKSFEPGDVVLVEVLGIAPNRCRIVRH